MLIFQEAFFFDRFDPEFEGQIFPPRVSKDRTQFLFEARAYAARGVRVLELRLSPLGSENDGPLKIGSALSIADAFHRHGLALVPLALPVGA